MEKTLSPPPVRPMPVSSKASGSVSYPFYLGGVATSLAGTLTHPLDLTKVRLQTMDPKPTMLGAMIQCVKTSGPLGLFEGITATWFRGMTYSLVRFWAYDVARKDLTARAGAPSVWTAVGAGIFAGVVGGVVSNPGDIVLIRMQAEQSKPIAERYGYKNAIHGLYKIGKDEGVGAFAKGLRLTVFRAILTNTGQLASYDVSKRALLNSQMQDGVLLHFIASTIAGTVGTTISQPADVIRSRLMAAGQTSTATQNPLLMARTLIAQEGVGALFRGYVPTWSRQTPQTVLTFVFLEQLKLLVDRVRGQKPTGLLV